MTEFQFLGRLGLAVLLGGVIGLERQWRQRTAGLRTNALVSTGAALFVLLGSFATLDTASLPRIAAQVVSGIGFLGAGVILREGLSIRGLNTAATLWCAAAVGTLAGAGWKLAAITGAAAVIVIHIALRPLALKINRQPLDTSDLEIRYCISLTCRSKYESHIRAVLLREVGAESLTLRALHSLDKDESGNVNVKAEVTTVGRNDLLVEQLVTQLSLEPTVSTVSWEIADHQSTAIS